MSTPLNSLSWRARVPTGFSQADVTAARLQLKAGQHYAVQASGTGWLAFGEFTAN